jgi:hypothetical protein
MAVLNFHHLTGRDRARGTGAGGSRISLILLVVGGVIWALFGHALRKLFAPVGRWLSGR